jgi:hypothetical protein
VIVAFVSTLPEFARLSGPLAALDGLIIAYIGPDQLLPLTSILGAIAGVLLMFWNRLGALARRLRSVLPRRVEAGGDANTTRR